MIIKYSNYKKLNENFQFNWSVGTVPPEIPIKEYKNIIIPTDLLYKDKIGTIVNINTRDGAFKEYNVEPKKVNLFLKKIIYISNQLDIHPNWLMDVINHETAGTFSSKIKNTSSSATGLIQFMDTTARGTFGLNNSGKISTDPIRQLDYVYAYLKRFKGDKKINSVSELYLLVFTPGYFGKPDSFKIKDSYVESNPKNFGYYDKKSNEYGTIKDFKDSTSVIFKNSINDKNFTLKVSNNKQSDIQNSSNLFVKTLSDVASKWIGCKETDSCLKSIYELYGDTYKKESWCSVFVWAMINETCKTLGIENILPRTKSTISMVENSSKNNLIVDRTPKPGCVFFFKRENGGHNGLVIDVTENEIKTIEGNHGDQVDTDTRSLDSKDFLFIHTENMLTSSSSIASNDTSNDTKAEPEVIFDPNSIKIDGPEYFQKLDPNTFKLA